MGESPGHGGGLARLARIRHNLALRACVVDAVRGFFRARGFLEVETPVRVPAPLPEAHIDPVPSGDWYLRTSPESCMKRLLAAGCPALFQVCRVFRRGERGRLHLPEFTMLEWYRADATYVDLMDDCEQLLPHVRYRLQRDGLLPAQGLPGLDLTPPWPRMTVAEAFARYADTDVAQALSAGVFDEAMAFSVEPALGGPAPVFLHDYPVEKGALARRKPDDPEIAERVELYAGGLELANGFSELCDPDEQAARFLAEQEEMTGRGSPPGPWPDAFLRDLAHMPEAAGMALGVDRLVMLFAGASDVSEVVAFPPEEL
ncbi:MAG: EF-P lysine aminoacylase EpmA [Desulfatibacillaceae bacterium]